VICCVAAEARDRRGAGLHLADLAYRVDDDDGAVALDVVLAAGPLHHVRAEIGHHGIGRGVVTAQPTPWKKSAFMPMDYETYVICAP
jgi:hypothetical protein